jgi:hypothetical protein
MIEGIGSVNMVRPPCLRTLRPKLWSEVQTEVSKRIIVGPKWEKQGTTYFHKQIDEFLFKHLQSLFERNTMKVEHIFNSLKTSLIIYLSFSADGSPLGASSASFHFSVLVSVVMDLSVWNQDDDFLIKRPLPLLICNDSETVDTMFWVGTKICEAIKILNDCDNWIFDELKGFQRLYTENLTNSQKNSDDYRNHNSSRYLPVEFKLCLLNGDSKVQQVFCGANSGKSNYRCYCCFKGSHEWTSVEGSFSLELPKRSICSSFINFKENWMSGDDLLKRITARTSAVLPKSFKTFDDVQKFINDHNIWSLWVTIDPLHVVSGHSKHLMDLLLKLIPKSKRDDLDFLLKKHCHVGFESKKHSGWKWRLIWGSFPVTWVTVCDNPQSSIWSLIYSWTKVCRILYQPASSRSCKNWVKLIAWTLQHFCCWRQNQESESLYFHLLWPHCIEQSWWISFSETMTESHESSWVLLKTLWKNCATTNLSTKLLFERWVGYLDEHTGHYKKRKSWISKQISNWLSNFIHPEPSTIEVNLLDTEGEKLREYLINKSIPSRLYSIDSDGHVTFHIKDLDDGDLPILPSVEVTSNYIKNFERFRFMSFEQ